MGHWLGLDHTFASGGCTHPGDKINDTPIEAEPQFFCSVRDDVCMDHFTSDQAKRMPKQWHAFRDKKARD